MLRILTHATVVRMPRFRLSWNAIWSFLYASPMSHQINGYCILNLKSPLFVHHGINRWIGWWTVVPLKHFPFNPITYLPEWIEVQNWRGGWGTLSLNRETAVSSGGCFAIKDISRHFCFSIYMVYMHIYFRL